MLKYDFLDRYIFCEKEKRTVHTTYCKKIHCPHYCKENYTCKGIGVPRTPRTLSFSKPPYAEGWDGATNFTRSICSGNYTFGANVIGDFIPVWIVTEGREKIPGFKAVTDVKRHWEAGNDAGMNSLVPAGRCWVINGESYPIFDTLPRKHENNGLVDMLGRW